MTTIKCITKVKLRYNTNVLYTVIKYMQEVFNREDIFLVT